MAWQLIYTSAPRLLEAGRSGFGTVARHRQINPLLAAVIERFSQFSRLPGLDPARVIFASRTVTAGSGRFHVLSFVRDSGADYTGRTNHLAHHLILDPREVAALGRNGPSPADVLLAMPWRQQWDEPPRWFESSDEIAVGTMLPQTSAAGSAWAQITGHANHVGLLAQGEASRGACLLAPRGLDLRPLFAESLRAAPERAWQTPFTTSFQPSDDAADFRWIGVEAGSDLAATVASGRPVLDLSAPHSLPLVESSGPPGAAPATAPPTATSSSYSFTTGATAAATAAPSSTRFARRKESAGNTPDDPFADFKPTRRGSKTPIIIAAAVLVLAILGAGLWWQMDRLGKERAQRRQIVATLQSAEYFNDDGTRRELEQWLAGVNGDRLASLPELARTAATLAAPLAKSSTVIPAKPDASAHLREAARKAGGQDLPPSIVALGNGLDEAAEWRRTFADFQITGGNYEALTKEWQRFDQSTGKLREPPFAALRNRVAAVAAGKRLEALAALIAAPEEPKGGSAWLRSAFADISEAGLDADARARHEQLKEFLNDWTSIENDGPVAVKTRLDAPSSADWEPWLKRLARKRLPHENQSAMPASERSASLSGTAPDEKAAPAVLYFARGNDTLSGLTIHELRRASSFAIDPAVNGKAELTPYGKDIANGLGAAGEVFKIDGDHLKPGKMAPAPPYRFMVSQSGIPAAIVFVGASDGETMLSRSLASHQFSTAALSVRGGSLTIDAAQLNLPGKISQPLWLNLPPNFDGSGLGSTSVALSGWSADLRKQLQSVVVEREKLEKRISEAKEGAERAGKEKRSGLDRGNFLKQFGDAPYRKDLDEKVGKLRGEPDARFFFAMVREMSNAWGRVEHGEFTKGDDILDAVKDLKEPANLEEAYRRAAQNLTLLVGKAASNEQKAAAENLRLVAGELSKLAKVAANPAQEHADRKRRAAEILADAEKALDSFKRHSIADGNLPPGSYLLQVEVAGGDKLPLLEFIHQGDASP